MQTSPWQSWIERLSRGWLPARRVARNRNFARLAVRQLEERRVLDAAAVAPPPVQITEDAGAVVINVGPADGEADVFKVLREEADGKDLLQVTLNGQVVFNKDLDQVASITIHGSSDAESLIVDFGDGGPVPSGGIHFIGGTSGAGDTISLVNGQTQSVSYSFTGPNDGQIQVGSGESSTSIQFSGNIETIQDSLATDSRSFTFGGTIADVALGSSTGTNAATLNIAGATQVGFVNPTADLTINDATGAGIELTVTSYTAPAHGDLSILGNSQTQLQFVGDTLLAGGNLHVEAGTVSVEGDVVTANAAIEISASESLLISSTGSLSSTGGSVVVTSPELTIDGTVSAREGGQIRLDAGTTGTLLVSGHLDAASNAGVGGAVDLFGSRVGLLGSAVVDVSGTHGGGTIRIGGDWRGENHEISNSQRTYVDQNVSLRADALQFGNGGAVVVWSDDYTVFYGQLSARGGADGGNGGQVEISGARSLVAEGEYDLTAVKGQAGTVLFDPLSIIIVGGTADGSDQGDSSSTVLRNNPGSNTPGSILFGDEGAGAPVPFVIYESEIEGSTANVILEARQSITTTGTFTNSDVLLQSNRSLTLRTRNAAGDGAGGIDLTGSTDGANLLFQTRGTGTITIAAATAGEQTGDIVLGRLQTENRAIQVSTLVGSITLAGAVQSAAFTATAGSSITVSAPLTAAVLQLTAKDGITINSAVSATTTTINADSDANGQGMFSLGSSGSVATGGNDLKITSSDIDIQSTINAGSGRVTLLTTASRTMALGNATAQYTLSGAELQRITAANLDFGGSSNGNMTIDGVTAAQSAGISGLVWLQAVLNAQQMSFTGQASTFGSLLAYASNGMFVNTNITTSVGDLGLDGDFNDTVEGFDRIVFAPGVTVQANGYLTLFFAQNNYQANGDLTLVARTGMFIKDDLTASGTVSINADSDGDGVGTLISLATIRTSTTPLSITAADIDLDTSGGLISGSSALNLTATAGHTVGLGTAAGQFALSVAEITRIRAATMRVETTGSISVGGVTATASQGITSGVTLRATGTGSDLTFSGGANTFRALSGFAQDAITVNSSITTTNGELRLESGNSLVVNTPLSTSGTTGGVVSITGGVEVNASLTARSFNITLITGATLDLIIDTDRISASSLILTAPRDIIVKATVQTTSSTADIQLIADTDHDGSGGVWIQQAGQVISGRNVVIEGSNLFATGGLAGPLDSVRIDSDGVNSQVTAAGNITIRQSAFAPTGSDMILEGRVQATGTGIIDVSSKNVIQLATTLSSGSGAIALHSPVVLTGNSQLTSVSGGVTLDGVVNGDAAGTRSLTIETAGAVLFSGAIGNSFSLAALNVTSSGSLAANASINAGSALIHAKNGISLAGSVTVTSPLEINADSDGNGTGTFALASLASISTTGNGISITAADVDLQGTLNSGAAQTDLLATNCRTVGLGLATGEFTLSGAELARITAATLHLGGANSGTISVNGVTAAQNQNIGQVLLDAGCPSAELKFVGSASVFQVLSGTAQGPITVDAPLQVLSGDLTLESAATIAVNQAIQTAGASSGSLTVTGGVTIGAPVTVGAGDIFLRAAGLDLVIGSGGVIDASVINFTAPRDIIVGGALQTNVPGGSIDLKADSDRDGSGGVWIQASGSLKATGGVAVEGSDLFATPGTLDSILIDADGSNRQILAGGGITLRGGAAAPTGADVVVNGRIQATGSGVIDVFSRDEIRFASTIESALGDVTLQAPVVLTGDAFVETKGGDILFATGATVDSISGQSPALQLNAGGGDIAFAAAVGGIRPLGSLTVVDSNSVSAIDLAAGMLSLRARGSINLNGNVSTTGPTTFLADSDANGAGDFSLASGKSLVTHNNILSITAADVHLQGTLSSGTAEMQFHASTSQARIGAGDASASFSISNAEIGRIINTTGLVTIGDSGNVGGISIARDENFNVGSLLVAFVTGAGIEIGDFNLSSSTILTLTADADGNGSGAITAEQGLVSADTLVLSAAEGILLTTEARVLDARNSSTGDIEIHEVDDLDVRRVAQEGNGGIEAEANGALRVLAGEPGVSAVNSQIRLTALGDFAELIIDGLVKSTGGPIQLLSDGDVSFGTAGEVRSTSGDILVVADNAAGNLGHAINMSNGALIDAGTGDITLRADGDIVIGRLRSSSNSGAAVRVITTSGGIVDAGDTLGPDVIAPTALFSAINGIGDRDPLETSLGVLAATNLSQGKIQFNDVSGEGLTIGTVDGISGITNFAGAGSDIDVVHSGLLKVEQAVTAVGGGNIRLGTVAGSVGADLLLSAPVTATGGDGAITLSAFRDLVVVDSGATDDIHVTGLGTIELIAGRDIRLGADVRVSTERDMIRLSAGTSPLDTVGAIVMHDRAEIDAVKGRVLLLADSDVIVAKIHTTMLVSITSNFGAIIDGHVSSGPDIVARDLALRAQQGIGSGDPLETSVDLLAMENTGLGGVEIVNAAGHDLVIGTVDGLGGILNKGDGRTLITSHGALLVQAEIMALGRGDVDLTSLEGKDLVVDARVHVLGGGNLTLTSTRDLLIHDTGDIADLKTTGDGKIYGFASQYDVFGPNVIVQTGIGSISTLIPTLEQVVAPQITAGGIATVSGVFGDPGSHNFTLTVDWGDGTVDVFHFTDPSPFTATHFFDSNPNTGNQSAPIAIRVTVADDPNSQFIGGLQPAFTVPLNATDSQTFDHGLSSVLVFTNAPGEGTGFFYVDTTLHVPPLLFPPPATLIYLPDDSAPAVGTSSVDIESSVVMGEDAIQRRLVLLVPVDVSGDAGEPVELDETVLDDLPRLFRRLPDGRYRMLVKDVGEERPRLLIDVSLRGGKPADDTESGSDKPPTGEIDGAKAMPTDGEAAQLAPVDVDAGANAPSPASSGNDSVEAGAVVPQEASLLARPAVFAAAAVATAVVQRGSWGEQVDRALSSGPADFGKAARLARRLRRRFAAAGPR